MFVTMPGFLSFDNEPDQYLIPRFGECRYAAGSWKHERRVIIKADIALHPGRRPQGQPPHYCHQLEDHAEVHL